MCLFPCERNAKVAHSLSDQHFDKHLNSGLADDCSMFSLIACNSEDFIIIIGN